MTNYQKILEMLIRYGTPEIEIDVVNLISNYIFKHSDIDKIELSNGTIYRNPFKNAIAKMEEALPTLSKEEKEELLKACNNDTVEDILSYIRRG